jgi:hypothetical protein
VAEETNIHTNGSFVGDSIEEFKKLPTWGKVAAAAVLLVVAYLGYRAYKSGGTSAQSAAAGTASPAGSSSPFPMVNGVPLLPSGTNPIYDPGGGLAGYQGPITSGPITPGKPTTSTAPTGPGQSYGLIPFGKYTGPSYANKAPGATFAKYTYQGTNYTLKAGQDGRLWGINPQGQQVLLYSNYNTYPSGGTGSGPGGMFAFMENPLVYLISKTPHTPSTVPGAR